MVDFDKSKAVMLKRELNKVQCWFTGYHAGAGHNTNKLGVGIPGEDAVRQTQLFLGDLIRDFVEQSVEPSKPEPVADDEGWITHDGSGMPVDGDNLVTIKCRDGYIDGPNKANYFDDGGGSWWNSADCREDDVIVAYKLENV